MMPRYVNPTSKERIATAPYNFVPLPERIFSVGEGIEVNGEKIRPWQMHNRFISGTHNGWVDLSIETLTPLYTRGPAVESADGAWDNRDARLRPDPYMKADGTPVIPGSSLRGMVRNIIEIISFSKIQPVTNAKPFFRSVADDRIGRTYRGRMVPDGQKPRGGVLLIRKGEKRISPRRVVPVSRSMLEEHGISFCADANSTPTWNWQHKPCRVKLAADGKKAIAIHPDANPPKDGDWHQGMLVLTGNAPKKKHEFVFLDSDDQTETEIEIPDEVWDRYHDEDQITAWQERAFPVDEPKPQCRKRRGYLRAGEPVFYLTDAEGRLQFLGRPQMFRLPYDMNPLGLIPEGLWDAPLDLAEVMFGYVNRDAKKAEAVAIKGRVFFEDAQATATQHEGGWYEEVLVPMILSSPKPTTFQHYLTQDRSGGKGDLYTYLKGDCTTIRGHKLYWHRWDDGRGIEQVKEGNAEKQAGLLRDLSRSTPKDTQHTKIIPVKAGVTFRGRVWFDNLTDLELGALLEALQLPEGCCHRLGMGKPLGLGSVRITSRLQLADRAERYASWQATGVQANEDGSGFRSTFVEAMLKHARDSGEARLADQQGLRQIARLDALYRMLTWMGRPGPEATAYMGLERFRDRPVLPTPHVVVGVGEPPWTNDPPRPGPTALAHGSQHSEPKATDTSRQHQPQARGRGARRGDPERRVADMTSAPAPTGQEASVKPVQKGQIRDGTLRRRGDVCFAAFEGDQREATITNPSRVPGDAVEGMSAEFYIVEQSKAGGVKVRFERLKR